MVIHLDDRVFIGELTYLEGFSSKQVAGHSDFAITAVYQGFQKFIDNGDKSPWTLIGVLGLTTATQGEGNDRQPAGIVFVFSMVNNAAPAYFL